MSDQPNGQGKQIEIPPGERYMFVRLSEKGGFQVLYSDLIGCWGLLKLADEWLELQVKQMFGSNATPSPLMPGNAPLLNQADLERLRKGLFRKP